MVKIKSSCGGMEYMWNNPIHSSDIADSEFKIPAHIFPWISQTP